MKKWLFLAVLLFVWMSVPFSAYSQETPQKEVYKFPTITTEGYDKLNKNGQVFVLFFSMKECHACQAAKKVFRPWVKETFEKMAHTHFYYVNILTDKVPENSTALYKRFALKAVPSFVVLSNDTVLFSHEGFSEKNYQEVQKKILAVVNKYKIK